MDDIRELSERLKAVEKRHRRLQLLLTFAAILAGALLLMGQVAPPRQRPPENPSPRPVSSDGKVRAEAFILVDAAGKDRATLVTDGDGSVFFVLFDKNGKPRADMQVNNYGPSLNFYDPNAKTRLVLGSTPSIASHVSNGGQMERNPSSSIVLFDGAGKLLWREP